MSNKSYRKEVEKHMTNNGGGAGSLNGGGAGRVNGGGAGSLCGGGAG